MAQIIFWYSIISTVVGLILLVISVGLTVKAWLDAQNKKMQVKIWMQDANGIQQALSRIIRDNLDKRYSSTNDMANAIFAVQASAFALYQSLYEERCLTEAEFKEDQQELRKKIKEQFLNTQANLPISKS
jgi:Rps23 Pro-64 3,4-dihydroxylase Tpa1-like proline 4-hydroxylase